MDKRFKIIAFFAFLPVFLLSACNSVISSDEIEQSSDSIAFVSDAALEEINAQNAAWDDVPISRGMVAKMISLTFADADTINQTTRSINFSDTTASSWYDRYINKAVSMGHLSGSGVHFEPENPLTLEQAQFILDRLDPDNPIRIKLTDENRHLAISYALWVNLYMQLLVNISTDNDITKSFGLEQENVIVLITDKINSSLPVGHVITDMGHFTAAGLSFDEYLDLEISILRRDREILAILGITNEKPVIRGAFVVSHGENSITIFSGGAERTYHSDTSTLSNGLIADIQINQGRAENIRILSESFSGVVKELTDNYIEITEADNTIRQIPIHSPINIFNAQGQTVSLGTLNQIIIGYNVADFIKRDGEIAAAVILRQAVPEHVRIVISNSDFTSRFHSKVELRSETGFTIETSGTPIEVPPGEIFRLSANENFNVMSGGRITIVPKEAGRIELTSILRSWPDGAFPLYRGILEITSRPEGFVIVNQLPLEEYLYGVIPSEMPASFGLEAAKVQAVTARSYAYNQFFANRFYMYGANIDDSTNSQVYNNFPETLTATAAVNETSGLYLTYGGRVINANFFSTSSGFTANSGDVWLNPETGRLDAPTPPYLRATSQYLSGDFGDLSDEALARTFLTDLTVESYESHAPWFRWNFELSRQELTGIIQSNLPRLSKEYPKFFQTTGLNEFPPDFAQEIGDFLDMEVISRGEGGVIREILITGTNASIIVTTEYAIRQLLAPVTTNGVQINRHNAPMIINFFILPSAFFVFDDSEEPIRFYGGGFGHGVGMSQNGVYGMVQRGYDYMQILAHFYPGTQVVFLSDFK